MGGAMKRPLDRGAMVAGWQVDQVGYVWGGDQVGQAINYNPPMFLGIRSLTTPLKISILPAQNGALIQVAVLPVYSSYILPLNNIVGVFFENPDGPARPIVAQVWILH
jgi:hypothetical protein